MASTLLFYKAGTVFHFPSKSFFQSELIGPGLGEIPVVEITADMEALPWLTYNPVAPQDMEEASWLTYNPVEEETEDVEWVTFAEALTESEPLTWNLYLDVNTDRDKKKYFQTEPLFEGKKKYYKVQLFTNDFLNNTLYWDTGYSSLELSWQAGGRINNTQQLSWKKGGFVNNTRQIRWSTGGKVDNVRQLRWGTNGVLNMAYGLEAYRFLRYRVPNNVNYGLYRIMDLTNDGVSTMLGGSTVELEIDHAAMVAAGESDEYGDHLRVTYCPENTAERELDVQVIDPNTANTKLRFKIQTGIPVDATVSDYRLYSQVREPVLFEETFRDKKGVYYFFANALSSNLNLVNGDFTTQTTGIQRLDDTNEAKLGFNVPDDAEVEVEFRFLDDGASDSSSFIGLEWRGDGETTRTFRLDNDDAITNNQIANFDNGSGFASLTPVEDIKTIPAKMKVKVVGSDVELYLNDVLLDTVSDATPSTGGMQLVFPVGSEVMIHSLTVSRPLESYTLSLGSAIDNVKMVPSSHKVLLRDGSVQNLQCTVLRLKRQPNNTFTLEEMQTIGEWGESLPATVNQVDGSIEIHLYNTQDRTLATVMELRT